MAASPRLALRLAGLQVYSRLLARSPGKALAPPPGKARRGLFAQQPLQARLTPAINPFAKNKQA